MAHIYERVVKLISKPPAERDDREVDLLIPWFQDMSGIIKAQKIDVTKDIVRNCEFQLVPADHVIIQQGEKGDCFYIILSGTVSVYINQALEEHDNVAESPPPGEKRRGLSRRSRPSTRARQPSRLQRTPNTQSTSQLDPKTSRSQGNEALTTMGAATTSTPPNDLSGVKTTLEARSGEESDHKTKADADVEKLTAKGEVDSGCFSTMSLDGVDENDNDVHQIEYTNNPKIECHDVEDDEDSDFDFSSDDDDFEQATAAVFDRKSLGVHIRELGAGKCFGELALVQTNLVRTASIIADQQTNLLVINRELYNRSLKAAQQHEFNLKKTFVTSFPLFRNWTPRQRNVMAMSLTRYQYQFGNTIARQGTPVKGIYFITQGSAMVSTDTIQHINQYPFLCTEKDVQFAKDVKTGRETRVSHPSGGSKDGELSPRGAHHWVKRKETYAEKERLMNYKNTDICVIGNEDYIGDVEVIMRLPTYCFSVKCLQHVDTFELDLSNFERQIVKKNPTAYTKLKNTAETKMKARVERLHRDQQLYMPVLERMLNKLSGTETSTAKGWKKPVTRSRASFSICGTIDLETEDTGGNTLSDFRENQRRFLRHRQREKELKDKQLGNNHQFGKTHQFGNNHQVRSNHQFASSTSTSGGLGRHLRMQHRPAAYGPRSSDHGIQDVDSKSVRLRSNVLSEALIANTNTRLINPPSTGRPRALSDADLQSQGTQGKLQRSNGVVPALGNDLTSGRHKAPRSLRELMISDSSSTTSSKTFPLTSRSKNTSRLPLHTDLFPTTNSRDSSDFFQT